ncbi:MAG: D-tyrosyl-tRNA(Tyr) deacylase [Chloroflexi bacterium RBG_13_46_9]|nr:MAG: D-tyrosyl-tRNA(Tyr) deacylase [Chloroflexi bacterium RBG_13_46_9]
MKIVIQRVTKASVKVDGATIGEIGNGLVVFIGVASGDTFEDIDYLVEKAVNLRIFADNDGKFNLSAIDVKGELLLVSQFTLLASTRKGRRPGFTDAASPEQAEALFNEFVSRASANGLKAATGQFQAHMLVEIHNDGPVTIIIDSRERLESRRQ